MRTLLAIVAVCISLCAYDYSRPATCQIKRDISITGNLGLWRKCQTPWGMYYTETLVRYL